MIIIIIIIILGGVIIIVLVTPPEPICIACMSGKLKFLGIAEIVLGAISLGLIGKIKGANATKFG